MQNTRKQRVTNLFIKSSMSIGLKESLSREARQAYWLRDYDRLGSFGKRLIDLSPSSECLGQYYAGLALSRQWNSDNIKAKRIFEYLAEKDLAPIRAAAMVALAGAEIASGQSDKSTILMVLESSRLALAHKEFITFVQGQSILSVLCSINGNHRESLQILRGLKPIIEKLGSLHDVVKSDFYNSVAYELNQLGKHEAAKGFITYSLKSPHLSKYPEWLETAKEVYGECRMKSLVFAVGTVPGQIVYKKKPSNVLQFRQRAKPIRAYPLVLKLPEGDLHLCNYPINQADQLESFVVSVTAAQSLENNAK